MANPSPTINQINAFNATQGTTIDFNIIGGTELVRSNRIYIYDLSDNSLICTHLYVSTESIHELPANTDSSIVYESGKSSADFVNGAQYYAQIQTFTDIAGTEGGSGLSVAKMFWCLDDPTLTIDTIPSTISTTSYNVSATYNANTSVVSNIIQQYQFSLYSATGSLLQSSGVVVGSGEQQGTSTAYDISYNFTGLSVGSSYYVTVDVTTTQGMNVSVQSNTFTVSIDTPTLGEATVVNNACDGYISVTSNLSSEYGGSASGEIASFVTDSVNNISSLKVNLDPIQDLHGYDSPWVGGAGANKWDEQWEYKNGAVRSVNHIPLLPNTTYFFVAPTGNQWANVYFYDENGTQKGLGSPGYTFTTTADTAYGVIVTGGAYGTTYKNDIAINYPSTVTTYSPWENICPITGWTGCEVDVAGVNVWDEEWVLGYWDYQNNGAFVPNSGFFACKNKIPVLPNTAYYWKTPSVTREMLFYDGDGNYISRLPIGGTVSSIVITTTSNCRYVTFYYGGVYGTTYNNDISINYPSTDHDYHSGTSNATYTSALPETVYGGTVDLVSGEVVIDRAMVDMGSLNWALLSASRFWVMPSGMKPFTHNIMSSQYEEKNVGIGSLNDGEMTTQAGSGEVYLKDTRYTTATEFKSAVSGQQLVYELATPRTIQLTPQEIRTLVGTNNVWSEDGDVEITYNIPITNLLVKRQDVADVSGTWLTLCSQPVTQASDMDFTFIDFLNQYGKTYKYALVPLLTQTQSGVIVEIEGGYTVSDEVQSIFDGVFISDSTGSQKCKANVGYGNVNMNQSVGSITPIGSQYPIIVTNSNNRYHNGSISGMIVPDDYYYNGNLSRIDMVNKRNELEQFLTNKRAKIIKDWNSNIWLVMIMDNIDCSFDNNYGMGIVTFNANWLEVGDPTNQEDLQATGLVDVGGV